MMSEVPRFRRHPTDLAFTKVRLPGGWMGNMSPYAVSYDGRVARTTEHLFQALRLGLHTDAAAQVLQETSPMGAKLRFKALVRDGAVVRYEQRGPEDLDAMRLCLSLKLEQNAEIRRHLTSTGSLTLVEDTTSRALRGRPDTFWGAQADGVEWVGHNHVGALWMELRRSL